MGDFRVRRLQPGAGQTKIRNVPIAVTPEGFWCCPSPAVLQKTLKNQNHQTKHRGSSLPTSKALSVEKSPNIASEKRTSSTPTRSRPVSDEQKCPSADNPALSPTTASERPPKPTAESQQNKISVGFGQPETSDLKVILYGKEGLAVKMSVHSNILAENSSYFSDRLSRQSPVPCLEILDCEDVEIYVETVGLMYCKEVKHRLIKQTVPRVLRILKVAESLGFRACVISCLDYLEAVPWVGEEEESVLSSIRHLRNDNYGVSPLLKRVCSDITNLPNDTLSHIMELVLKSSEDRGRREMKSLVLKLLKENNIWTNGSADICIETLYSSCRSCLDSLLALFRQASAADFADTSLESKDPVMRQITLDADNLLWLVEILADRRIADDFAVIWANQNELAGLHSKIPIVSRHLVSGVSARLFVGIGRGEILPLKDTRQLLLHVWLQPLIDDYSWLQHCCRSFDRKVAEEGIGQTILTLPLEDQQNILLSWLGSFLKVGDNCPNLQRAFEVWWRRTFIRPYAEKQGHTLQSETSDRS